MYDSTKVNRRERRYGVSTPLKLIMSESEKSESEKKSEVKKSDAFFGL